MPINKVLILLALPAAFCEFWSSLCLGDTAPDNLVSLRQQYGDSYLYYKLWRQKLLVTPGNVARYVHLPADSGVEDTVSMYVDEARRSVMPGGYWLTGTQPVTRLADFVGHNPKSVIAQQVRVRRWDAPVRESTAQTVHEVWLVMLSHVKPDDCADCIWTDTTTEIFSASNASGVQSIGQLSKHPDRNTIAFVDLAGLLIDYTRVPASKRDEVANKIDKEASSLLRRLAR